VLYRSQAPPTPGRFLLPNDIQRTEIEQLSGKKAHKSEIDRLRELIRQSGFPLEIELSSVLDSARDHKKLKDMDVSMGAYYLDKDTKEGRELDSKVSIPIKYKGELKGKKRNLIGMFLNLLIQCKKIPGNAWVFFKPLKKLFLYHNALVY